mmetsp:Transcript_90189/g.280788  ORF Transcript_90189/g.280788 Transcript_90189/m.280788 type:complete len:239 (-) Transcript_90189:306-1022(-)
MVAAHQGAAQVRRRRGRHGRAELRGRRLRGPGDLPAREEAPGRLRGGHALRRLLLLGRGHRRWCLRRHPPHARSHGQRGPRHVRRHGGSLLPGRLHSGVRQERHQGRRHPAWYGYLRAIHPRRGQGREHDEDFGGQEAGRLACPLRALLLRHACRPPLEHAAGGSRQPTLWRRAELHGVRHAARRAGRGRQAEREGGPRGPGQAHGPVRHDAGRGGGHAQVGGPRVQGGRGPGARGPV